MNLSFFKPLWWASTHANTILLAYGLVFFVLFLMFALVFLRYKRLLTNGLLDE
jgi:hypothetical protein